MSLNLGLPQHCKIVDAWAINALAFRFPVRWTLSAYRLQTSSLGIRRAAVRLKFSALAWPCRWKHNRSTWRSRELRRLLRSRTQKLLSASYRSEAWWQGEATSSGLRHQKGARSIIWRFRAASPFCHCWAAFLPIAGLVLAVLRGARLRRAIYFHFASCLSMKIR